MDEEEEAATYDDYYNCKLIMMVIISWPVISCYLLLVAISLQGN